MGADMAIEDRRIVQQHLHPLDAIEDLDQPGVMEVERALHHLAEALVVFGEFGIRRLGAAAGDDIQPRQRSDAEDPIRDSRAA